MQKIKVEQLLTDVYDEWTFVHVRQINYIYRIALCVIFCEMSCPTESQKYLRSAMGDIAIVLECMAFLQLPSVNLAGPRQAAHYDGRENYTRLCHSL